MNNFIETQYYRNIQLTKIVWRRKWKPSLFTSKGNEFQVQILATKKILLPNSF